MDLAFCNSNDKKQCSVHVGVSDSDWKKSGGPLSLSSSLSTDVQAAADCCGRTIHDLEMQRLNQGTKAWTDRSFISIVFVLLDWHNCSLEIVATSLSVQLTKP